MKDEDYRPVSPDLTAFKDVPLPPPQRKFSRIPSYSSASGTPLNYPQYQRTSIDAAPFFSPAVTQPQSSYFPPQHHAPGYQTQSPATYSRPGSLSFPPPRTPQEPAPAPPEPPRSSRIPQPQVALSFQDPFAHYSLADSTMARISRRRKVQDSDHEDDSTHDVEYTPQATTARTQSNKKRKATDSDPPPAPEPEPKLKVKSKSEPPPTPVGAPAVSPAAPAQSATHIVEIRTKFPVARIKRIMQADEDIGKVAQATPTAVSKALELFMITLVTKGADEARAKNSKRVTAQHLKAALMADRQFDFLDGICAGVPDHVERKGRAKSEDHEAMDSDEGVPVKKGKGKGKGKGRSKREKVDDDDEEEE